LAMYFFQPTETRNYEDAVFLSLFDRGVSQVLKERRGGLVVGADLLRQVANQLSLGQTCSHESSSVNSFFVCSEGLILYQRGCGKEASSPHFMRFLRGGGSESARITQLPGSSGRESGLASRFRMPTKPGGMELQGLPSATSMIPPKRAWVGHPRPSDAIM